MRSTWTRSSCGFGTNRRCIRSRGFPFSDRRLVECMREGAKRFGWEKRPTRPATLRDGRWLVGYGMAAAIRSHFQAPTKVKVRLGADGIAVVRRT